ncbi:histidine kinase [Panacibacter sp. DH6]|uniref:Histidine kinase n=1 Tax=Panacibacter microcysteis TaxID=2793269 RepID=A0A931E6V9_9BACT|nr:histidine kinase [Panacibacter microcysteis]MBG9374836.1 histidine kinase [Panacibacter microcysteis]
MSPWKPNRMEWITFFALMPFIDVLLNYLLFGERIWSDVKVWLYSFPIIYLQGFCSWYLHIVAMHFYRVRFPFLKQAVYRLLLLFFTHVGLSSLTFVTLFYGYDMLHFLGYVFDGNNLRLAIIAAVALTLIATTAWEAEYMISKWKESLAEKEQLEQMALQYEFETLKSQVNPHFLFNCFNTLSSLITEDPDRAEIFLNDLSKVYRYLLRNNEDGLSTLQNELTFINSYFELLKTRHGDTINLQVEVDRKYHNYLIPSLTLQLLVENAVKHNVISRQSPLSIDIFSMPGNKLAINNNLHRKTQNVHSNKVGLSNIKMKYELLQQQGFKILEDQRNFTVILPLIWNNTGDKHLAFHTQPSVQSSP